MPMNLPGSRPSTVITNDITFGTSPTSELDFAALNPDNTTVQPPFVTSYPIITTRGRQSEAFDAKEGFFIQYIIKFQPGTRGDYKFRVDPGPNYKLCKMEIRHIGANMPCTEPPGPTVTQFDNVVLSYNPDGGTPHDCGVVGEYTFKVNEKPTPTSVIILIS